MRHLVSSMPIKVAVQAIKAIQMNQCGISMSQENLSALENVAVQAVYIPIGNTIPQKAAVYEKVYPFITWRQMPNRKSMGTQKEAVAHVSRVVPFIYGMK